MMDGETRGRDFAIEQNLKMNVELQTRNIQIILGVFLAVSVLIALIETWKWFSRTGRIMIDVQVKNFVFSLSYKYFFIVDRLSVNFFFI